MYILCTSTLSDMHFVKILSWSASETFKCLEWMLRRKLEAASIKCDLTGVKIEIEYAGVGTVAERQRVVLKKEVA